MAEGKVKLPKMDGVVLRDEDDFRWGRLLFGVDERFHGRRFSEFRYARDLDGSVLTKRKDGSGGSDSELPVFG